MNKAHITLFKNEKEIGTLTWKWADKKFLRLESYTLKMTDPEETQYRDLIHAALDHNAFGAEVRGWPVYYGEVWNSYEGLINALEKMSDRHKSFTFVAPDLSKEQAAMEQAMLSRGVVS